MKKLFITFMMIFSVGTYSQESSSSILQKVVGKWEKIDPNNLTIIISKSETNSDIYEIEISNVNNSGNIGTFEGTVVYKNEKLSLVDNKGNSLGFFNENYFIKSLDNEIVGSLKFIHDMLYFQNFTDLCTVEDSGSCGMGVSLDAGYLEKLK
ncbi:MAG: hypothetical protein ACRCTS_01105 [Fusobacteriaceae bacterium]